MPKSMPSFNPDAAKGGRGRRRNRPERDEERRAKKEREQKLQEKLDAIVESGAAASATALEKAEADGVDFAAEEKKVLEGIKTEIDRVSEEYQALQKTQEMIQALADGSQLEHLGWSKEDRKAMVDALSAETPTVSGAPKSPDSTKFFGNRGRVWDRLALDEEEKSYLLAELAKMPAAELAEGEGFVVEEESPDAVALATVPASETGDRVIDVEGELVTSDSEPDFDIDVEEPVSVEQERRRELEVKFEEAKNRLAFKKAQLGQYEGWLGTFRGATVHRKEIEDIKVDLAEAEREYTELRAHMVADQFMSEADTHRNVTEAEIKFRVEQKDGLRTFYEKFQHRSGSVKIATGIGMLGGSAALGWAGLAAATGGTAALGGLAAARGFLGSMGLYQTMRNIADRNVTKLAEEEGTPPPTGKLRKMFRFLGKGLDKLTNVKSAEDIKKMNLEEVNLLYAQIHERAIAEMDLDAVSKDKENPLLRAVEARRAELVAEDTENSLKTMLSQMDEKRLEMAERRELGDKAMKALSVGFGVFIGTRTFEGVQAAAAKVGASEAAMKAGEVVGPNESAGETTRIIELEELPKNPLESTLAKVVTGDSISRKFANSLLDKKSIDFKALGKELGVDPEKLMPKAGMSAKEMKTWADELAGKYVKAKGLDNVGIRMNKDSALGWTDDFKMVSENLETYTMQAPKLPVGKLPPFDLEKGFTFGDGHVGKFAHDISGNISFEGGKVTEAGMAHAKDLLLNDQGLAKFDTISEDDQRMFIRSLDMINRDEEALKAMMKAGKGTSEEAEMLRTMIRSTTADMKSQYGDIFSGEAGQRLAVAEASARDMSIREISLGGGLKGEMVYNASGRPVAFVSDMKTGKEAIKTLFEQESWSDVDTWHDRKQFATRIFEEQKAYDALAKAGKANSIEAKFLKSEIEVLVGELKRTGATFSEKGLKSLKALSDETRERLAGATGRPSVETSGGVREAAAAKAEAVLSYEGLKEFTLGGRKVTFSYNTSTGEVSAFHSEGGWTLKDEEVLQAQMLKKDWVKIAADKGHDALTEEGIAKVQSIVRLKQELATLKTMGMENSKEATYLKEWREAEIKEIEREYGDILND